MERRHNHAHACRRDLFRSASSSMLYLLCVEASGTVRWGSATSVHGKMSWRRAEARRKVYVFLGGSIRAYSGDEAVHRVAGHFDALARCRRKLA